MSIIQPIPAHRIPCFLAGPADRLRLSLPAALAVVVFGVLLTLCKLRSQPHLAFLQWPEFTLVPVTALPIAVLAARWFGSRIGMLAGLIQCSLVSTQPLSAGIPLAAAVTVAMCSFAVANVDSPRGRASVAFLSWIFSFATGLSFIAGGWSGPSVILIACGLFLLINQDVRSFRFFVSPIGVVLFALCFAWTAVRTGLPAAPDLPGGPSVDWRSLPPMLLPWLPLALLYLWARSGEGLLLQPLWRFVLCWIIAGCALFLSGDSLAIPSTLPGLSVFLAVALAEFLQRHHRSSVPYGWPLFAMANLCVGIALIKWVEPSAFHICMFASMAICLTAILSYRFASRPNSVQRSW